jgi:hypothetical protein
MPHLHCPSVWRKIGWDRRQGLFPLSALSSASLFRSRRFRPVRRCSLVLAPRAVWCRPLSGGRSKYACASASPRKRQFGDHHAIRREVPRADNHASSRLGFAACPPEMISAARPSGLSTPKDLCATSPRAVSKTACPAWIVFGQISRVYTHGGNTLPRRARRQRNEPLVDKPQRCRNTSTCLDRPCLDWHSKPLIAR